MTIYVRDLKGLSLSLNVVANDTVGRVKNTVQGRTNIPVEAQRMMFNGQVLADHRALADYNMHTGAVIRLETKY